MRQHLARLVYASALSGCSLIYNPSNLPDKGSMPPDAALADADPSMLHLDEVKSPVLLEGAGQGGSAPQILVVYGGHITKAAQITVTPATNPMDEVAIEVSGISIADDGNSFAALVRAAYMDNVDETGPNASGEIKLTVTVTQDGAPAPVTIDWALQPLDQLAGGMQSAPAADKRYARAEIDGDVIFMPGDRAIVRAVGDIKITGKVTANAAGQTAGAGGCAGGAAAGAGACFGGGKSGGGGGGFALPGGNGAANTAGPMSGDPLIKVYDGAGAAMNRGGGGGGGDSAIGGGGGGTIELTAGGDIDVRMIEANGTGGANSGLGRGAGGGSGGAVVLRASGTLTQPTSVAVAGGPGGSGTLGLGNKGGDGSVGRWRFDAAMVSGTAPSAPAPKRGPMIVRPASPIFESKNPTLMIAADPAGSSAQVNVVVQYPDDQTETKMVTLSGPTSTFTPPPLQIGLNKLCVLVPDGNFVNDEAKNCIEVAFIP